MNHNRWMRLLCALLCAAMLFTYAPSIAEDGEGGVIETPAPTEAPTPIPTEAPTAAPEVEPEPQPTDEPEPSEAPSESPEQLPDSTPEPEPTDAPEAAPQASLEEITSRWIAELNAQRFTEDYDRALWLYERLMDTLAPGSADGALEALTRRSASALGYARAYEALLRAAGFSCATVVDRDAAWNAVKIDGSWTHVDAFMDDAPDAFGLHFGLTDAAMARDHRWDASAAPACADPALNYFVHEKNYLAFFTASDLHALLAEAVQGRAEKLQLYNAGELSSAREAIAALLSEIDPGASADVSESGCYAAVALRYAEAETPAETETPEDIAPEATKAPSATEAPQARVIDIPAPAAIVPASDSLTLGVGETASVSGWTLLPAGAEDPVSYRSADPEIASVDEAGAVTAHRVGATAIVLSTDFGPECTIDVHVYPEPTKVYIETDRAVLGAGEALQLRAALSAGAAGAVTFSIPAEDRAVAAVTPDGLLEALNPGSATVTATAYNGQASSFILTVLPAPESIDVANAPSAMGVGASVALSASVNEGSAGELYYRVENSGAAAVDEAGTITAIAPGHARVVVYTYQEGVEYPFDLEVMPAPAALTVPAVLTIGVGESYALAPEVDDGAAAAFAYESSDPACVAVSESGVLLGVKAGEATVTVTTHNGISQSVLVRVQSAPTSVSIELPRAVISVGETMQASYALNAGAAGSATFFMLEAHRDIATATPDGFIEALSPGRAYLTVTTYNGVHDACYITVLPAPQSIEILSAPEALGVGASGRIEAAVNAGSASEIFYESANPAVATVDADGTVTARSEGTARILLTTYLGEDGPRASVEIAVRPAPEAMTVPESIDLGLGEYYTIQPDIGENTAATFTYESSDPASVAVAEGGLICGVGIGESTVTVTAHNGVSESILVHVHSAPASIVFDFSRPTILGVGETLQANYILSEGSAGRVTYFVLEAHRDIISVTEDGLIEALAPGRAYMNVTTYNGRHAAAYVTVLPAPRFIDILSAPWVLGVGASGQIEAALNPGSAGELFYELADPDAGVIALGPDGSVEALREGSARVTVYTYLGKGGPTATVDIKVKPAPTELTVPASVRIGVGEYYTIRPRIDEDAAADFTYKSSDPACVAVTEGGLICGIKTGSSNITVTTHNGISRSVSVTVVNAPTSISVSPAAMTLGVGETATLSVTLSAGSASALTYVSNNPWVVTVEDGIVTAVAPGHTAVTAATYNGKRAGCEVKIVEAPTALTLSLPREMGVGQRAVPSCELKPAGSHTTPVYTVVSGDAVEIQGGAIVAVREGTATVRAESHVPGVYDEKTITVRPAPTAISFPQSAYTLDINDFADPATRKQFQLTPVLTPSNAATGITYDIKTPGYFTISADGLITPIKRGSSAVTATTHNGKTASFTVTIQDRLYPQSVAFAHQPPEYLDGDSRQTFTPELIVTPADAVLDMVWTSSNESVASVDPVTGEVTALAYGRVTITGTSERNPNLRLIYSLVVTTHMRCMVMPEHRTTTAGIASTLRQIVDVRESAYAELNDLYVRGWISSSELTTRKGYIDRAFDMYYFPWMTPSTVLYWKAANSEGGMKDFKPGTVYYGMPYTQNNRVNSVATALSAGYWKDSGAGYYVLQTGKFTARNYPGSDCSSYVSMAIWGTGSSRKSDTTSTIAKASYYTTLSGAYATDMRPGDILVKGGSHVVMFLYYANADKSQIVVIEQGGGGSDLYSNCVSTSVRDYANYINQGYILRRVNGLDMTLRG